jgi:autonomous glycyl radical cofactor GrcA
MSNILGKAAKAVVENWKLVANSEQKLAKSQLSKTTAVVFQSQFDEDKLVARVTVGQQYVDFTVDMKCKLEAGDHINPASIRVYDLVNRDGVVITRLWGEVL